MYRREYRQIGIDPKETEKQKKTNLTFLGLGVVIVVLLTLLLASSITFNNYINRKGPTTEVLVLTVVDTFLTIGDNTFPAKFLLGSGQYWESRNGIMTVYVSAEEVAQLKLVLSNNFSDGQPSLLHAYGLLSPPTQDGISFLSAPPVAPGRKGYSCWNLRSSDLPNQEGSFLLQGSYGFQNNMGVNAPLVIRGDVPPRYPLANKINRATEVLLYLQDACPTLPGFPEYDCNHTSILSHVNENPGSASSIVYKYFLANGQTVESPHRVALPNKGTYIRMRIINAASATNFFVSFPFNVTLFETDANLCNGFVTDKLWVAMGQRLDVLMTFSQQGSFPIVANAAGNDPNARAVMWLDARQAQINATLPPSVAPGSMGWGSELNLSAFENFPNATVEVSLALELTSQGDYLLFNGNKFLLPPFSPPPLIANPNPLILRYGKRANVRIINQDSEDHTVNTLSPSFFFL